MDNVVEFPKEKQEECVCNLCDLAQEFMDYVVSTETPEQLKEVLRDLVEEAHTLGYRKAIMDDLDNKLELLNHIESDFDEEE